MLERAVYIRGLSNQLACTSGDVLLSCSSAVRAVLDVGVRLWQVVERRLRKAEALSQD